ncbi:MAG: type II toxin-antitoxin system PemK/MazF family toxin [Pseudomonadota bacterium]
MAGCVANKPLPFHPRAGQLLVCDFSGFKPPEIGKVRPVIIISPKLPNRSGLVAVVPLSTTAPKKVLPYVCKLSKNYTPWGAPTDDSWAKCDLVMNIGLHRLSSFKVGRRKFVTPQVSGDDLKAIRSAVLAGLGFK